MIAVDNNLLAYAHRRDSPMLGRLLAAGQATGAKVHDARIAALCLSYGISELWSADRDFTRFPELITRNPLIA